MKMLNKLYVLKRLFMAACKSRRGQAMTEYALILAAVALVAFTAYQALGTSIQTLVNKIAADL